MKYQPTIGLEIHIELKIKTKMFCHCLNDPNEKRPNVNICPVCMGHPGTLPVINKEAVKKVLIVGRALKGKIADYSRFDRKNYFYPDLPKGYQISQYKYPLIIGGELNGVKITRIHLEEDTGRLIHERQNMKHEAQKKVSSFKFQVSSYVDFNRAGMPLMELVTEPDIKSGKEARKFAEELQLILRYLDISDADMEKGQMRVEANISLAPIGAEKTTSLRTGITGNPTEVGFLGASPLGVKVEIKNLNSFRAVERAINYEIKRQAELLEKGEKIKHETRGWSALGGENGQKTFSQREKEKSHDYRYFPEPDLPPLRVSSLPFSVTDNKGNDSEKQTADSLYIPELPQQKRERFKKDYGLKDEQIEIIVSDKKFANYFEEVAKMLDAECLTLAANYLITDLAGDLTITPAHFTELIKMIARGGITSRVAKDVLQEMVKKGVRPTVIINERSLGQITDEITVNELSDKIIRENPKVIEDYKKGKKAALQFLIGQGMKLTKGSINPEILKKALKQKIW